MRGNFDRYEEERRPAPGVLGPRIIPEIKGDPDESGRRNRAALRYLHHMAMLRTEPNKHKLERILLGQDDGD